jgi:hypothetical protein
VVAPAGGATACAAASISSRSVGFIMIGSLIPAAGGQTCDGA